MAFDQKTRNLLQRTVSACRNLLDAEFASQRRSIFGINDDGTAAPLETLSHLSDEDMQTAKLLRDRLDHLVAGLVAQGKKEAEARKEAVGRVTREQAFTVLNRLAALRMSEEREIVLECVRQGTASEGFQLFMQSAGGALGSTFESYRAYLFLLFDELAIDLGVLFSRWDPAGLLFPRQESLEAVLKELNGTGTAATREDITPEAFNAIWAEDETIGWIYQYYNDQAERKKMRDESSAPRNSRELAVRNQFFTPRYVVEFLTDNTLGRIWYEMTQGETKLKEQCRYLVRRPTEVFLAKGESTPEVVSGQCSVVSEEKETEHRPQSTDHLSQEDLLKQPVFIPHRPLKDPRTILMLDPACGSMHFGLYAFDLFEVIYDEAWALEEKLGADALSRPPGMKSLHATYAGKDAFLKDVPRLIIEHNLHGIDIDPRCAQIAGLSLWLRAQKAWQRLGLKPAERPAIRRSNIVCAEPMPGEKELLREFVEREFPAAERAVCLRLLEAIFDKMQLAGEAGSLLKIEEEIRSAIEDARDAWQKLATKPPELFTTTELNQISTAPELTGLEQAVSSLTTDPRHLTTDFWERIEERIYAALRDYAEQAENGGGFQRRLFAEDAARGFAFIDVCRKRYDVALMNPPYGDASHATKEYLQTKYGGQPNDLFGCFVERTLTIADFVGSLTSRTFLFFSSFEALRSNYIFALKDITTVLDLGFGVLDGALVETCAMVLKNQSRNASESIFIRLNDSEEKGATLLPTVEAVHSAKPDPRLFPVHQSVFVAIDGAPMPYWVGQSILNRILSFPSIYPQYADIRLGAVTSDNDQFLRLRWEVDAAGINPKTGWASYAKGGDYSKYFGDIHLLIDWRGDGEHIKLTFGQAVRLRELDQYLKPGLTYPLVTVKGMNVRVLPADCIFDNGSPSIFLADRETRLATLGVLNSRLSELYIRCFTSSRHWQVGYVRKIPWPSSAFTAQKRTLASLTGQIVEIPREMFRGVEPTAEFLMPRVLLSSHHGKSFSGILDDAQRKFRTGRTSFKELERTLDETTKSCYQFSDAEWSVVQNEVPALEESRDQFADITGDVSEFVYETASWFFGVSFGRWDIRYATGEQAAPELPDPFAPLPVCPPGQLQNAQGLPARPEDVPAAYPVRIPWDGILVDDPNHPLDLERRVREVIEIIWSGQEGGPTAEAIEHEACEILGVKSLRDYFRKPAGFFADHLKRYSKSRRQAPIYWPLSTASGSYTLWIYYHRLTPDTLYKCLQQFVEPKIKDVEQEIHRLRTMLTADEAGTKERKQLADAETLINELKEMHTELSLWAPKWKPNLNDGVLITASPLWKLFRLPKWRTALEACWKELDKGDYDWAHLARTLWPARVREKCKTDRSLAIAHGLEDLCEIQAPVPKKRAAKKAAKKTGNPAVPSSEHLDL